MFEVASCSKDLKPCRGHRASWPSPFSSNLGVSGQRREFKTQVAVMFHLATGNGFGFLILSACFWNLRSCVNALKATGKFPLAFSGCRGEAPLGERAGSRGCRRCALCHRSLSPSSVSRVRGDKWKCRDLCHTSFIMVCTNICMQQWFKEPEILS